MESDIKIEKALPVFLGFLVAIICCAFLSIKIPVFYNGLRGKSSESEASKNTDNEPIKFYSELPGEKYDLIRDLYRSEENKDRVIYFFSRICGSLDIAKIILAYADVYNISPALVFALAWEESRFNSKAINSKNSNGSIDRGLFQLNSNSFPGLETQAFFDPELSAKYGISHLKFCLDSGGTEIAGLAMYNVGTNRVRSGGTPKATLDYISRILQNKQRIEHLFRENAGKLEYLAQIAR